MPRVLVITVARVLMVLGDSPAFVATAGKEAFVSEVSACVPVLSSVNAVELNKS